MVTTWKFYLERNSLLPPCGVEGCTHITYTVNTGLPIRNYGGSTSEWTNNEVMNRILIPNISPTWDSSMGSFVYNENDIVYVNDVLFSSPAPTHYVSLSMGFVPPELITYFETYIAAISDNLMTYLAPLPDPWQYMGTTYDRVTNSFNLWLYIPATAILTMAPGGIQDIYDWFAAYGYAVLGAILTIIGLYLAFVAVGAALLILGLIALFAGVVILVWRVYDAVQNEQKAITVATNLSIQIENNNKEDAARNLAEYIWTKSAKAQSDCITRLQTHRDSHLAILNGFLDQYAKYPGLVTELTKLKNTFTTNANSIISEFKTTPYAASTCDTYFVRLNSEISTSTVAKNEILGMYINPAENYSIACKGWTNQSACEKGGCYWYDSACHQEEACYISNPLGGCILSANTGKTIVGVTVGLVILGSVYWLMTRKRAEVSSIYIGAKEAATSEVTRAKTAYREITAPTPIKPLPVTTIQSRIIPSKAITPPIMIPKSFPLTATSKLLTSQASIPGRRYV
jgi:hypothetical protein